MQLEERMVFVRPRLVRIYDALVGVLTSPAARRSSIALTRAFLLLRALVPGRLVQRLVLGFVRMEAACCRSGTPHYKFLQRYIDHFAHAGSFERMRGFLRAAPRALAARRLDAWLRIGLFGTLRHELMNRHLGAKGVAPRLLMEAQLALSPGCDLTCEGCYTSEDRGGSAPRRERIAYLVDELVGAGAFGVHVIGKGEPFLSPRWANELLDVIEQRPHVFFTVATHAMHIDDALARRVSRLGNLVLLVAIDGPEELHDARRGAGSYRRVHQALARLRAHGALFGFSCMVSAKSLSALTSPEFVRACERSGCSVGIYSRYFPLAGDAIAELALTSSQLANYRKRFEAVREHARLPLFDLDEVEQHTGCHSRAGESIYIDGITGQVAPCLRVPFAPADCTFTDTNQPGRLIEILNHPYFVAYRDRSQACPSWCGANLEAELAQVGTLLEQHCLSEVVARQDRAQPSRLEAYKRRLPVLSPP